MIRIAAQVAPTSSFRCVKPQLPFLHILRVGKTYTTDVWIHDTTCHSRFIHSNVLNKYDPPLYDNLEALTKKSPIIYSDDIPTSEYFRATVLQEIHLFQEESKHHRHYYLEHLSGPQLLHRNNCLRPLAIIEYNQHVPPRDGHVAALQREWTASYSEQQQQESDDEFARFLIP
jgi:hypothetical protein